MKRTAHGRIRRWSGITISIILLVFILGLAVFADWAFAVTVLPIVLASLVGAVAAIGALGWLLSGSRMPVYAAGLTVLCLVTLRAIELSPIKPFLAFHRSLDMGMSQAAVLERLEVYFPDEGRYRRPVVGVARSDALCLTLDRNHRDYNAEIVCMDFESDRLVRKEYTMD